MEEVADSPGLVAGGPLEKPGALGNTLTRPGKFGMIAEKVTAGPGGQCGFYFITGTAMGPGKGAGLARKEKTCLSATKVATTEGVRTQGGKGLRFLGGEG